MEDGKYADYTYYTKVYLGTEITAEKFGPNVFAASALVDQMTFGRVQRLAVIPDQVKRAVCAAAECLYRSAEKSGREIASETNDGYSVTYNTAGSSQKESVADAVGKIKIYLSPTGLLYRGFSEQYDITKDGDGP